MSLQQESFDTHMHSLIELSNMIRLRIDIMNVALQGINISLQVLNENIKALTAATIDNK